MSPRQRGARNKVVRLESVRYQTLDGQTRERLRVAVRWKGQGDERPRRYRFSLKIDDSRENRRRWEPKLRQIERDPDRDFRSREMVRR